MSSNSIPLWKKLLFVLKYIQRKKLVIVGFCMITVAILDTIGIGMTVPLVASLLSPKQLPFAKLQWLYAFNFFHVGSLRLWICILLPFVFLFKSGLTLITQKLINRYLFQLRTALTMTLISNYFQMPYLRFIEKSSSEILYNSLNHVSAFSQTFLFQLLTLLAELTVLLFVMSMLLVFNPIMTGLTVGVLFLVTVVYIGFLRKKLYKTGVDYGHAADQSYKWINQSFQAFKDIRVGVRQLFFYREIEKWAQNLEKTGEKSAFFQAIPKLIFELIFAIGLSSFCLTMMLLHWSAAKMIVTLTLFGASIFRILPAFNRMTYAISSMKNSQISLEVIYRELSQLSGASKIPAAPAEAYPFKKDIQLKSISFHYPNAAKSGISEINVTINKGQKIGIIGKSGAGKTTLIDLLLGILPPSGGDILLDGHKINAASPEWLALIGYVPQNVMLLNDTVCNNIAFGIEASEISQDKVMKVLKKAQLDSLIQTYPEGIHTPIGEQGVKLSGGQRQRLGIARALYHDPEILVFDEATSSLDVETESLISKSLLEIGQDKTCLIIAHRLSTVISCDILHLMEDGKLVASGTFEELSKSFEWLLEK